MLTEERPPESDGNLSKDVTTLFPIKWVGMHFCLQWSLLVKWLQNLLNLFFQCISHQQHQRCRNRFYSQYNKSVAYRVSRGKRRIHSSDFLQSYLFFEPDTHFLKKVFGWNISTENWKLNYKYFWRSIEFFLFKVIKLKKTPICQCKTFCKNG